MRLLVYSTDRKKSLRLMQAISALPADALSVDMFQSVDSFFGRLRQPVPPDTAALIVAGDAGDLQTLVSKGDFLSDLRVVVALPDDSQETLTLARRLWPRYIAPGNSDFSDVAAVLEKMAEGRRAVRGKRQS